MSLPLEPAKVHLKEIDHLKLATKTKPMSRGVLKGPLREGQTALVAHNAIGSTGQGQGEISKAAEEVRHPMCRLEVHETECPCHQGPIELKVNLCEIDRRIRHVEVECGQVVGQLGHCLTLGFARPIEGCSRCWPARLQPKDHMLRICEGLEHGLIGRGKGHQIANDPDQDIALRAVLPALSDG